MRADSFLLFSSLKILSTCTVSPILIISPLSCSPPLHSLPPPSPPPSDPDGAHGIVKLRDGATPCDLSGAEYIQGSLTGHTVSSYTMSYEGTYYFADPLGNNCARGLWAQMHVSSNCVGDQLQQSNSS